MSDFFFKKMLRRGLSLSLIKFNLGPPIRIKSHHSPNPKKKQVFTVRCYGRRGVRTIVTAKPAVVRQWVSAIRYRYRRQIQHRSYGSYAPRRHLVVGLSVNWTPGGVPATLQLCVGLNCLIVQLKHVLALPSALRRLLKDDYITFVGLSDYMEARRLQESPHGLQISRLFDFRDTFNWGEADKGKSTELLACDVFNVSKFYVFFKEESNWDWEQESLRKEQVGYACFGVFVYFLMGRRLKAWDWSNRRKD